MKTLRIYLAIGCMLLVLGACSSKVSNENIDRLEGRELLLKKTTELNDLKLELEKNLLKQTELTKAVENINKDASASAGDAEEISRKVSRNPGEAGVAKDADRASKRAASDAKKARKLNGELEDVNDEIKDLRKDIEKKERELSELKAKIEFVPNN